MLLSVSVACARACACARVLVLCEYAVGCAVVYDAAGRTDEQADHNSNEKQRSRSQLQRQPDVGVPRFVRDAKSLPLIRLLIAVLARTSLRLGLARSSGCLRSQIFGVLQQFGC